ncbi:MAG: AraC family transcriptional regulator [Lachnospiraceae bacterium]|nr:AraC family transcriptional regulator [Lachnospiraceae bacterium]
MSDKKKFEEKMKHGTIETPVSVHKMTYEDGMDVFFYSHWHKEFELLIVTDGNIDFTIEDRNYSLSKDDIVFINSNLMHSAFPVNGKGASFFAIDFAAQFLDSDLSSSFANKYLNTVSMGNVSFHEYIKNDSSAWQQRLKNTLYDLFICDEHDVKPYELMLKSRVFEIWNILYNNALSKKKLSKVTIKNMERFTPCFEYIKENLQYDITLKQLADIIPMSEGQFCRSFKKATGYTPIQYLNRCRILYSLELLSGTNKKISDIALSSGFENISYFNKVFLRTIGCTPKEYREHPE